MGKLGSAMCSVYLGRKIPKVQMFLLLPVLYWAWCCVAWDTLGVSWAQLCLLPACALHPQPHLLLGLCEKQKWLWCCVDIIYFSAIAAPWVGYQHCFCHKSKTPCELLWRKLTVLQAKPVHLSWQRITDYSLFKFLLLLFQSIVFFLLWRAFSLDFGS